MNSKYEKYFDEDINSRNHLNIKTNFLSSTEYNIKNYINENNNESESDTFDKPKRRSINDKKGRTFICKICNKSYLSYSALYTHCKGKHNSTDVSDRARGRPRKNTENYLKERTKYNPLDKSYFLKKKEQELLKFMILKIVLLMLLILFTINLIIKLEKEIIKKK